MAGVTTFGRVVVFLVATAVANPARATELGQRQNPGFISVLPTEISSSIVAVTATATPSDPPAQPAPAPIVPPEIPSTPSLTPLTSAPDAPGDLATSVGPVQGPYFGGIPVTSPDVALVSIFLNLFFLGAVVHSIEYRRGSRRPKRGTNDTLSGPVACFCLARVATCALRLVWLGSHTSVAIIFTELVTENAGTGLVIFLNYRMARRMIGFYNVRLSLWARSVVDSFTKIGVILSIAIAFALNAVGLVLFVLGSSSGQGPAVAAPILVQASAAVVLLLDLSFLGAVVLLRVSADHPIIDRCGEKSVVFFVGAGLFTTTSHFVRMAATLFIWRPTDATSTIILSKTMYYSAGFGVEVVTVAFYIAMKIDLLFSKPLPPTWASRPKMHNAPTATRTVSEVPISPDLPPAEESKDGRFGGWASTTNNDTRSAVANPPIENDNIRAEKTPVEKIHELDDSESDRFSSRSVSSTERLTASDLTQPSRDHI